MPAKTKANTKRSKPLNRKQSKAKLKEAARKKTLPSTWNLVKDSFTQLSENRKLFAGIMIVYLLLTIIFVRGLSGSFQLSSIQQTVAETLGEGTSKWQQGAASYGLLLGSAVSARSEIESFYQTILILILSLAIIWSLRKTYDKKQKLQIRDSFYKGMYPLIPYLIVLFVLLIYCLPFGIASSVYATIQANGLAITGPEQIIWTAVLLAGAAITAYLLISGIFALYIVTLPDMRPVAALREARALVRFRRWDIAKRFLVFLILSLLISAFILIPMIVFFSRGAEVIYIIFSMFFMVFSHSFAYRIYRGLI